MATTVLRYVYISDGQLDMLASQIPASHFRRIARELEISISIASVSVKRSPTPTAENRYARLRIVDAYMSKKGVTGTLDMYPPPAWLVDAESLSSAHVGDEAVLYFGSRGRVRLCLTGSRHSVIGAQPSTSTASQGTAAMIEQLLAETWDTPASIGQSAARSDGLRKMLTLELIEDLIPRTGGVSRHLQFAAYPIVWKKLNDGSTAVLAAPLYIGEPIR